MKIAAIDQGTTSTKGLLVDGDGAAELMGGLRHQQILPQSGWVEHDASELLANVRRLIDSAAARGAGGVALANQGETIVAWDRQTGEPVANAIVWQDQRTAPAIEGLRRDGVEDRIRALSGLPLDAYFSASKLRWILDNVDGARDLARENRLVLGTSDSFFIHRLTGRYVTDVTTASRTSLMNLTSCAWDAELCAIFGVPIEILPEIVTGTEPIGDITTPSGKIPLLASMVDQVAALYGHGCRNLGDGKVTVGTGAFALVVTGFERPADPAAGTVLTAGWPTAGGRVYAAEGGVYTAAAAVEWLLRIGLLRDLAEIDALAGSSAASEQVFFVPALAGLACPHWDRTATGLFIGMDTATSREVLIKAVLEGVAFRIAEVLDALGLAAHPEATLSLDGGLVRSSYFTQFLTDVAGRSLSSHGDSEVTALGAAGLGRAVFENRDPGTMPVAFAEAGPRFEPRLATDSAERLRSRFTEARIRASGWRK